MTFLVDIEPGKWALAFDQGYGPCMRPLPEHLEMFVHAGGGWDSHRPAEIFAIHQIKEVKPKTYWAEGGKRFDRINVAATFASKEAAETFLARFFAIGVATDEKIRAEKYRRIAKFAARERAKALRRVHASFPHIFGKEGMNSLAKVEEQTAVAPDHE